MALTQLIHTLKVCSIRGDVSQKVTGIEYDSRCISPGNLFVALPGLHTDGHRFVFNAEHRGAVGAVVTRFVECPKLPVVIQVPDTHNALASLATKFWGHPSADMHLIGITGTNGKTTLTYLLESILYAAGLVPGRISTIDVHYNGKNEQTNITTPMASDLQALLYRMRECGTTHVVMEVSSHALDLQRVRGSHFQIAVFTNLTRDHLDYHGSMEHYADAKELLFSRELTESAATRKVAVVNARDPYAQYMTKRWHGRVITYGQAKTKTDVYPLGNVTLSRDSIHSQVNTPNGKVEIHSSLCGEYNLENLLGAIAVAFCLDLPISAIEKGIQNCTRISGRIERVHSQNSLLLPSSTRGSDESEPAVFVDYAHTPSALTSVLSALRSFTKGRLIAVFGCGGDRDKGKRSIMGKVVADYADVAIVTSDNSRNEDTNEIIEQIVKGLNSRAWKEVHADELDNLPAKRYAVLSDRGRAIKKAINMALIQDTVLVAGKGHETFQTIGNVQYAFDDRKVARQMLEQKTRSKANEIRKVGTS